MTYTPEEAAFYTALGSAVRRHVLDPNKSHEEELVAIENDMVAIAGRRGVSMHGTEYAPEESYTPGPAGEIQAGHPA